MVFVGLISNELIKPRITNRAMCSKELVKDKAPLGAWKYTISEVKSPYKEGVLFLAEDNGNYKVTVKFSNGVLSGQDVLVQGNQVNFNMNISGLERVSFVLMVDGDCIGGVSYSAKGSSKVVGMRQLPYL